MHGVIIANLHGWQKLDRRRVTCYLTAMQLLTHRTNVLFSSDEYGLLVSLSKERKKTLGELVRHAVKKTYAGKARDSFGASLARIRQMTKGVKIKKSDYRALVTAGRKYDD